MPTVSFYFPESDDRLFPRLAYVTMESYVNRLERYGMHTLEYILVCTYALCILKMAKKIEQTNTLPEMARDIAKIRRILDTKEMEKSLSILPQSMRLVLQNAIRDIDFNENWATELGFERTSIEERNVSDGFDSGAATNLEKSLG